LKLHDHTDSASCAAALAEALAGAVTATLGEKPRATLALSGGRSPQAVLPVLAAQPIDWARVDVTLVDERRVPPHDADSNAGMVRRCFIERGAQAAALHPLWTGTLSVGDALADAQHRLNGILPADVAYLGMGPDGHIASLFPASDESAFERDGCAVISSEAPTAPRERISLTLSELMKIPYVYLHITGTEKRRVLEHAAAGAPSAAVPISLLLHARPDLQVFAGG